MYMAVSYTHLRAHETGRNLVCRLLLEKKKKYIFFFFLMIRRPPRSTLDRSSAASDVYKRQIVYCCCREGTAIDRVCIWLSLIHISEPTRQAEISYAVFCLKKKKNIYFFFF